MLFRQSSILFISILFISCSGNDSRYIGEYELYDMEYQLGFKSVLDNVTSDETWEYYIDTYGDDEMKRDYKNMTLEEKEAMRNVVRGILDGYGKKSLEQFTKNSFISFFEDSTFSFYFYPYYFDGTYQLKGDSLSAQILNRSSIVDTVERNYSEAFTLKYGEIGDKRFYAVTRGEVSSLWNIDTLFVRQSEVRSESRDPKNNQWRFQSKPRKKLIKHLEYLIKIFKQAIKEDLNSIDVNAEYHCSPLRFYANGIALRKSDSKEMQCWKNQFDSEGDFLEANRLLRQAFRLSEMQDVESRFVRNVNFLIRVRKALLELK